MFGIFNKETNELDCDPEPMVFDSCEDARSFLYNADFYDLDNWFVRELTDEEAQKVKEASE